MVFKHSNIVSASFTVTLFATKYRVGYLIFSIFPQHSWRLPSKPLFLRPACSRLRADLAPTGHHYGCFFLSFSLPADEHQSVIRFVFAPAFGPTPY